jgi:GT2 family glycosyltransferase
VERVRLERPRVEVLEMNRNAGFGAGCNAGIKALAGVDCDALRSEERAGAASPKILFDGRFCAVTLESPTHRRGRGDSRRLGVRVSGVRVDGVDVWRQAQLVSGFWGEEPGADGNAQWTAGRARIHAPVGPGSGPGATIDVRLSGPSGTTVALAAGETSVEHVVDGHPRWYGVPASSPAFDVVNSAGAVVLEGGYGADRGYLEPDVGQYDKPDEVFAWSGAGVLLSKEYLGDVGLFHEPLFLYYEDLDLSWRARRRGWRHVYAPDAVERHVHSASSVEGSDLSRHYVERNRLVVLIRNAPARMAWAAAVRFVLTTASYFRRDCLVPPLFGRPPSPTVVRRRVRAFVAFLRVLPAALIERRRIRRRGVVGVDEVRGWLASGPAPGPTALPGSR